MNDASPRFEAQTSAASLLPSEGRGVSPAELAQHAGELSVWFTEEGLRGATAGELFEGYCRRLSAMDFVILRAYVSTQTLHPQWTGYGYTWRREFSSVREQQFARGPVSQEWMSSPFYALIQRSLAGEKNPWLRRRLELGPEQRDFPVLADFYAAGATDYVCLSFQFGVTGDPSHGTGVL
jgi:adenylate cyclase